MTTYDRRRPAHRNRRNRRWFLVWGGIGLIVLIQLSYPGRLMTPFTRIDGVGVAGKSDAEITAMLEKDTYLQASVRISTESHIKENASTTVAADDAGLIPDAEATIDTLRGYPLWQRLIPLSIVTRGIFADHAVQVKSVGDAFDTFVKAQVEACTVAATNASVSVKNGTATLVPSRDGQTCDTSMVRERLLGVALRSEETAVVFSAKKVAPVVSDGSTKKTVKAAQKLIDQEISLSAAGKTYEVDTTTLGSLLSFAPDTKDPKKLTIDLNGEAVREYLASIEKNIYRAPTASSKGEALNYSATKTALRKQILEKGDGAVEATTVSIAAGTTVEKLYAANASGLQELLATITAAKGQYGISVRMLDGTVTNSRGDAHYHPASTYKLYVAYGLLKGIEKGTYRWSDQSTGGLTISQCFDKMIINSDNTCAEWLGNKVGWSTINSEVHAIGLNNTTTLYGKQQSTANDETLFLMKLQNGDLLGKTETDRLLSVMKKQVYRTGIPAGLKGITVADKVGFLNADLHDSAIVYAPKQTYILTIMTTGSSWASIADTAARIQLQLDRM